MGTNFYFVDIDETIKEHIGKRSAAGLFCWNCGISLNFDGNNNVHRGGNNWLKECPICGKQITVEKLINSTGGRELGFNKVKPQRKRNVASCSSFTWAMSPGHFANLKTKQDLHIQDEYGTKINDFGVILSECPIMFWDAIGQEFSQGAQLPF